MKKKISQLPKNISRRALRTESEKTYLGGT